MEMLLLLLMAEGQCFWLAAFVQCWQMSDVASCLRSRIDDKSQNKNPLFLDLLAKESKI
jgi:hypothetical protein